MISSAGPLTNIYLSDDTACQVDHTGDTFHEFYEPNSTHGDCGTFIWAGGAQAASNVYGPQPLADGNPRLPYTLVSQTGVTGSGTSGDPYQVVTVVDVGSTGLHITQTDSYVVGDEFYRTDIEVSNSTSSAIDAALYHAGDCYLQNSDFGYGWYDTSGGGIYCTTNPDNSPPDRIEGFVPLSTGSNYYEADYGDVWAAINGTQFPNTCACATLLDNGAGVSWSITVPANGSVTRSLYSAFSPTGQPPPPPDELTLAPPTATNNVGSSHTVTATLKDGTGNPISGGTILFSVSGANTNSGNGTTNTSGEVTFTYTGTTAGGDTITACYDKDTSGSCDTGETTATASKTWEQPVACTIKITNGGWIVTDDGDRGSFGGNARETSTGTDTGQEQYQDHGPAEPLNMHSITITDITCNEANTQASIFGTATINGTGSHTFQIDVEDNGEPGKGKDHYRIRLDTGYDSGDHILRGGNVQIH